MNYLYAFFLLAFVSLVLLAFGWWLTEKLWFVNCVLRWFVAPFFVVRVRVRSRNGHTRAGIVGMAMAFRSRRCSPRVASLRVERILWRWSA